MDKGYLERVRSAQGMAKSCIEQLVDFIKPGVTDVEIHDRAAEIMTGLGSTGWWIHGDPALVLTGERSTYSARRDPNARPAVYTVAQEDIVSVDVAPMAGDAWGDFARTFFVYDGAAHFEPRREDDREGYALSLELKRRMLEFVDEGTTFAELWRATTDWLRGAGYQNCDYHDNFGHTVELDPDDRVTIADGVDRTIFGCDRPFTYEPHFKKMGGSRGYKHEDMYIFSQGGLVKI